MKHLRIGWIILAGILLLMIFWSPVHSQEGPNLLRNGDFEEGGPGQAWPFQDGIPEIQVAPGWRAFYLDDPPAYIAPPPDYCQGDARCAWGRPEFRGTAVYEFANRVRSGQLAQKYFSWNRQHEAGLYQQVSGIRPGTRLRFSVWIQTWSCMPPSPEQWNVCPTGDRSNNPAPMHIWVGIDPTGGTDWAAPTVVRSPEGNAWDTWTLFQVEAVAQSDKVTVFIHSRADWQDRIPRINNDVYIDDASLVAIGQAAPTPPPPPPTSAATAPAAQQPTRAPAASPTPRPDGCRVHVVQPGDTLFGISLRYGIPMEELERLNAGSLGPNKMIFVGQELILSCPAVTPTPTPLPPTPTPEATPTPQSGLICVLAYHDRSGDASRQADTEELLPNAVFLLSDATGIMGQYTTDGISEPYCFAGLQPGAYQLSIQPPVGYEVNGPAQVSLALAPGGKEEVALPLKRGASVTVTPAVVLPTPEGAAAVRTSVWPQVLRWTARIGGVLLVVLALGIPVWWVLSRR
ncbi:MAG: LysM peptidoglycan-binding domain-containing protein [Anaerolineae bacterium]|nr:LysM peptidoglycan-binding domain-containing protein [Anaerolineae bacterium]